MKKKFFIFLSLVSVIVLLKLANWQYSKYIYKKKISSNTARHLGEINKLNWDKPKSLVLGSVILKNAKPINKLVYLGNQFNNGKQGYLILLPAIVSDNKIVLINLGWNHSIPNAQDILAKLEGDFENLFGWLKNPSYGISLPCSDRFNAVSINLDFKKLGAKFGYQVYPLVFNPESPLLGFPTIVSKKLSLTPARHLSYSCQWLLLSLVVLTGVIVFCRKSSK